MSSPPTPRAEIGDLVLCQDNQFRQSLHLPEEPGLVVSLRKDQAKVFFPSIFGDTWVPTYELARIRNPGDVATVAPWMQRVWFLAKTFPSIALEIERFGPDGNAVRVFHSEIEVELLDYVRHALGEELRYLGLAPAGLHKMEASIAFVVQEHQSPPTPPSHVAEGTSHTS